jgi:type II secretory pathway component PulL
MNIFNKFRFYIYSFAALFSIFLFTAIIEFSFLNIKNSQLEDNLNRIFIKKFPNEKIKSNIISQVSSLLSSSILSKNRLDLISLLSKEIANIENISLVSINYDSSNFSFELEARDYQDIQDLVDTLQSRQINISIGSSRRAKNFIIGELNVQDS